MFLPFAAPIVMAERAMTRGEMMEGETTTGAMMVVAGASMTGEMTIAATSEGMTAAMTEGMTEGMSATTVTVAMTAETTAEMTAEMSDEMMGVVVVAITIRDVAMITIHVAVMVDETMVAAMMIVAVDKSKNRRLSKKQKAVRRGSVGMLGRESVFQWLTRDSMDCNSPMYSHYYERRVM